QRGYNPLTSNYLMLEINCAFDARKSKHSSVPTAIENKAILSVCSELYKGNDMIHIIASDIAWNNVSSGNKNNTPEQTTDNRKKCNQDLLNFEDRCRNKKPNKTSVQTPITEIEQNNNTTYETCENESDGKSENNTEKENESKCSEIQNETEKNTNQRAEKLKSVLRNAKNSKLNI
ncbi:10981_t:CDS:1, partial [Racocetra fulgida]